MSRFKTIRRTAARPAFFSAAILLALALTSTSSARASGITYTCAANIDTLGPATLCSGFNTEVAALYASTFANANASIYIQFGDTGLGENSQYLETVSYAGYRGALTAASSGDPVDSDATASLTAAEPATFAGNSIVLTGALAAALGLNDSAGETANGAFCSTPGSNGCYNGVITLATPAVSERSGITYYYGTGTQPLTSYDIFSVAQHETDEILGTISCGGTSGSTIADLCGSGFAAAADLFRYDAAGSLAGYTSSPAYFSYDSGGTSVAPYNYLPNGGDYGDFSTTCAHVQDAFGCPGSALNVLNDGRPEVTMLDALGYNLIPADLTPADPSALTPEPSSLLLVGSGLSISGLLARRRVAALRSTGSRLSR